jgi:NAD(P)H dehydrogenase (quinone)
LQAFWDTTSGLWATGALAGKYAGAFVSTAGPGGGQEVTIQNTISTLTHHGVVFVPLGYAHAFGQLTNLSEVHGGACRFLVASLSPSPISRIVSPT